MSVTPEKDPNYIYAHPYATLIADEYRMRGDYRIMRPGGTNDHLMLLTLAGRGLFRTPRGDIATRSGFSSARVFTAVFKTAEGVTPRGREVAEFSGRLKIMCLLPPPPDMIDCPVSKRRSKQA